MWTHAQLELHKENEVHEVKRSLARRKLAATATAQHSELQSELQLTQKVHTQRRAKPVSKRLRPWRRALPLALSWSDGPCALVFAACARCACAQELELAEERTRVHEVTISKLSSQVRIAIA